MKSKILYSLIIILSLCILFIIGIKFYYGSKIIDERKILYVMDCLEEGVYDDDGLISSKKMIISLIFYEDTVNVCVKSENICEELSYRITDNKLYINKGQNNLFFGLYNIIELSDYKMILEKLSDNGNRFIYHFLKPVG